MHTTHPNIDLGTRIDTTDMAAQVDLFHPDVIWHFFNPMAPDLAGAYHGVEGIAEFFQKVGNFSQGTFAIEPRGAWAVGDELVVVQPCNRLTQAGVASEFDVVVVWRLVDGKIAEIWDIPAIHTARPPLSAAVA